MPPVAPAGGGTTTPNAQQAAAAAAEARHQELLRELAAAEKLRQQQQAAAEAARQARDRAAQDPKPQVLQAANTAYQKAQLALADTTRRLINIHRQIVQSPLPTLQSGKPDTFFTDPTVKKEFDGFDLRPPQPLSADPSNSGEPVITPEKVDPSKYSVTGKDSLGMWGIATDQMNAAYANAWPPRDPPSKADVANYWQSVVNANRSGFPDVNLIHPGDSLHLPGFTLPQREVVDPQERYLGKDGKPKSDWAQTFTHDVETGVVQPQDHAFRVMMSDPTRKKDALALMQQRQVELLDPSNPDSQKPNAARDAAGLDAAISAANALKPQPPNNGSQPGGAQDPNADPTQPGNPSGRSGDPKADANLIFTGNTGTSCVPVGTPEQQLDKVNKAIDAHKSDPTYAAQLLAAVPQGQKSTVAQLLAERLTPKLYDAYTNPQRQQVMSGLSSIADSSPQAADAIGKAIAAKLPNDLLGVDNGNGGFAGSLRLLMQDGKGFNLTASISKQLNADGHTTARDELSKAFLDATNGQDPKQPKGAAIVPGVRAMLSTLAGYKDSNTWTDKARQAGATLLTANQAPAASPTAAIEQSLQDHLPAVFVNGDGKRQTITVQQTGDGQYSMQLGGGGAPFTVTVEHGASVKSVPGSLANIADWYSQQPANQNNALKSITLRADAGPKDAAGPTGHNEQVAADTDYTTGHMNFYSGDANLTKDCFDHEFGHLVGVRVDAKQDGVWAHLTGSAGTDDFPNRWGDAVRADGGPISDYARDALKLDGQPTEDFADSWSKWEAAQDQGPAAVAAFKRKYPNRAAILEEIPKLS
jgi:hypothetical protein